MNIILVAVSVNDIRSNVTWIVGNVGQYGYYRVNYDEDMWNTLTNQLNTNHKANI